MDSTPDGSGALVTGGGRDLDQLKQEVQLRADRNMPPLGGIASEDARAALSGLRSLDRNEWALAFSAVADRHWERARSLEASDRAAAVAEYWQAWRLHHFARWPTENAPAKQRARQRALEAFRIYTQLLDPPIEIVRLPFEGEAIVAYLRLPAAPRPPGLRHCRP